MTRTLGLDPTKQHVASSLLNALVAPGVTYSELSSVSERAMLRAIDRVQAKEQVEIPETRVDALLSLFSLMIPEIQYCDTCNSLDLHLKAGKWSRSSSGACGYCRGMLMDVVFDPPVIAWTTGTTFDPGTEFDHDQIPLTESSIDRVLKDQGRRVDGILLGAMLTVDPSLTIVDLCRYLALNPTGPKLSPIAVLDALANPDRVALNSSALINLVTRANTARGMKVATRENGEKVSIPSPSSYPSAPLVTQAPVVRPVKDPADPLMEPKEFILAALNVISPMLSEPMRMRTLLLATGFSYEDIPSGMTGRDRWAYVLTNSGESLRSILEAVLNEYPRNPDLRALMPKFLDTTKFREVFYRLSPPQRLKVISHGLGGLTEKNVGLSEFEALDAIFKHGSVVCAYRAMEIVGGYVPPISVPPIPSKSW